MVAKGRKHTSVNLLFEDRDKLRELSERMGGISLTQVLTYLVRVAHESMMNPIDFGEWEMKPVEFGDWVRAGKDSSGTYKREVPEDDTPTVRDGAF